MAVKQISVFLENKPGRLAIFTDVLKDNDINLRALSIAEASDFGIVRFIVNDVYNAATVLRDAGYIISVTDVLALEMPDKPGAMADLVRTLGDAGMNLEYLYAFTATKAGSAYMIIKVNDVKKASELKGMKVDQVCIGSCTNSSLFDMLKAAAMLKDLGADTYHINKTMYGTKTIARLRLESALTESAEFYAGGLVAVCCISQSLMDAIGATEDDADDISSFPRSIQGVEIGVLIKELRQGGAKISLRTGEDYNASEICGRLGGGGHPAAAGAQDDTGMEQAKKSAYC